MISDSLPQTLACVALSAAFLCQAEPPPSAVQGKILDASRTPIPGATVTATTSGRAAGIAAHSGRGGEFWLTLPPGSYTFRSPQTALKTTSKLWK